jgi:hypothetical protein
VAKLVDDCKAEHIADLTDAAVMAAIGAMKAGGASLQTLHPLHPWHQAVFPVVESCRSGPPTMP